jgi:hypothetical protein
MICGIISPVTVMRARFVFSVTSRLSVRASHDCDKHEKRQVGGSLHGENMKEISLSRGQVALVDDVDYDFVNQWKWYASPSKNGRWYAVRMPTHCKMEKMHRLIMNCPDGMTVDHINGDGLDNRRSNLRVCTEAENNRNRGKNINNTSGYKGVHVTPYGKYAAAITAHGKQIRLGNFSTPEDAARAYDKAAKQHHGEFAWLNFPEGK